MPQENPKRSGRQLPPVARPKSGGTGKRKKQSSGMPTGLIAGIVGLAVVGIGIVVVSQFLTKKPAATDSAPTSTASSGAPAVATDASAPNVGTASPDATTQGQV